MNPTTITQKLFASVINAAAALIISSPVLFIWGFGWEWKLAAISVFFVYEMLFLATKHKRDLGMIFIGSHWQTPFTVQQYIIYNVLYTLSFATIFFQVFFPGDLLLLNLLLIQLPFVLFTKSTLHGFLSHMTTIK